MEIFIEDIPEEGLEIDATEGEPWLAGVLREAQKRRGKEPANARLHLSIHRVGANVDMSGEVEIASVETCDRCLAPFENSSSVPLHTVLAPMYESERQKRMEKQQDVELVKEDLEFSYYEGDRFELDDIVREQVILAEPMTHVCKRNCKGLCAKCGKDLNEGQCGCRGDNKDPRWDALKGVKVTPKKETKV